MIHLSQFPPQSLPNILALNLQGVHKICPFAAAYGVSSGLSLKPWVDEDLVLLPSSVSYFSGLCDQRPDTSVLREGTFIGSQFQCWERRHRNVHTAEEVAEAFVSRWIRKKSSTGTGNRSHGEGPLLESRGSCVRPVALSFDHLAKHHWKDHV